MTQTQADKDRPIDTPTEGDTAAHEAAQQRAVDAYLVFCHECVWWKRGDNGQDEGSCHRHAPRPDNDALHPQPRNWPTTKRLDFCAECELKPCVPTPMKMH